MLICTFLTNLQQEQFPLFLLDIHPLKKDKSCITLKHTIFLLAGMSLSMKPFFLSISLHSPHHQTVILLLTHHIIHPHKQLKQCPLLLISIYLLIFQLHLHQPLPLNHLRILLIQQVPQITSILPHLPPFHLHLKHQHYQSNHKELLPDLTKYLTNFKITTFHFRNQQNIILKISLIIQTFKNHNTCI